MASLIPALSCRSCRPNAPFAELIRLSRTTKCARSIGGERLANDCDRPGRREAAGEHLLDRSLGLILSISPRAATNDHEDRDDTVAQGG